MAMPPPPITSQGSPPTEEEIIPGHTELSLEADEIDNLGVNTATDGVHDNESTYDAGSDTTSIWSDIFGYRVKNGRTYHSYKADCKFKFPLSTNILHISKSHRAWLMNRPYC